MSRRPALRSRPVSLGWSNYLMLGIAAGHWPLGVMARNYWQLVHPGRVVIFTLGVAVSSAVMAHLLTKAGVRRSTAVFTVFIATVMFMRGGQLVWQVGGALGWLLVLLPVILAAIVAGRLGDHPAIRATSVGLAVALAAGPFISLYLSFQESGPNQVISTPMADVTLVERPNVILVMLDGYPGFPALERDFGRTKAELISDLQARGFQVPTSVWSPYWSTELAVPSILQMSYPVDEGPLNITTRRALHQIIGGDNHLVDVFRGNGYRTVMVEAGWTGSSCSSAFHECITSPWLDDLLFFVLWEGIAGKLVLDTRGHAYTVASQATMGWLEKITTEIASGDHHTFVFAHLIAPHPPFFLDGSCQTIVTHDRMGDGFYRGDVDRATREGFFFDQIQCVDRFMELLADSVPEDDVLLFVSDHGTSHRELLATPGNQWSRAGIVERMNVFAAVRTGRQCDIGDSLVTPNLIRRVLSCYAPSTLEDLPARIFLPGMFELDSQQVESLLTLR